MIYVINTRIMHRFKSSILSGIWFLFLTCDDPETIVQNIISPDYDYQLNLTRTDSGVHKYSASISWSSYTNEDFGEYQIMVDGEPDTSITNPVVSSYTFSMNPGEFKQVGFTILDTINQPFFVDSIQIFTRIIEPAVWTDIEVTDYTELTFTPSEEPDDEFQYYVIYRTVEDLFKVEIIDPIDCTNTGDCTALDTLLDQQTNTYTDSSVTTQGYCYVIATYDLVGNFQPSTIITREAGIAENPDPISEITISEELTDVITIEWMNTMEDTSFYRIDIWRGNNSEILNTKLASIIDFSDIQFEDRNDIGSGTTWYYLIRFTNIHGRSADSEILEGITYP